MMSWGQLSAAVQQTHRTGGKKAAEGLDQKIGRAKREGQSADDIARLINTVHPDQGYTLLHRTCEVGDPDVLQVLLRHGGDPNLPNEAGVTPLLAGLKSLGRAQPGSSPATKKEIVKYERLSRMLLEHAKFDSLSTDVSAGTGSAVHLCVAQDYGRADALLPLLQLLLDKKFDPNGQRSAITDDADTALLPTLHAAVKYGHFKCAEALVQAGVSTDTKATVDGKSCTAIELCESCDSGRAAELKRLTAEQKAKAKVLGVVAPSGATDIAANSSAPDEIQARIREEAKAELKRQKNRAKKKKKKKKTGEDGGGDADEATQPEPEPEAGGVEAAVM